MIDAEDMAQMIAQGLSVEEITGLTETDLKQMLAECEKLIAP